MKNQPQPNNPSQPDGRAARHSAARKARNARRDPLAYTPPRAAPGPDGGSPARPAAGPSRRRNRRLLSPVVRWNRRLAAIRNLLLMALAAEVVYLCLTSPLLEVERVTVSGATIRKPVQIAEAAGLTRPGNIFRAPAGAAEKRLLALPEVKSVQIQRQLPRTLAIVVTERSALASVATREGCWLIDSGGLVYRQVGKPLSNRPVLVVPPRKIQVGEKLPLVALSAALDCLNQLPALPLARDVRMYVDGAQEAWLNNPDGFKIRLGPLDNAPDRLRVTGRLLNGPDGPEMMRKAIALDMTTPNSEVYRPRPGSGPADRS